jgi:hypothetical protein
MLPSVPPTTTVKATPLELAVGPRLGDDAVLNDVYHVGALDGGEPVRNGDGGATLHEPADCLPDSRVVRRVESRCGLVE